MLSRHYVLLQELTVNMNLRSEAGGSIGQRLRLTADRARIM